MQMDLQYQLLQDLTINQISPTKSIIKAHLNSIQCLAANTINKQFASGSHDKTIKIWDLQKTKQLMQLSDHKQGIWSLQYSKDCGQLLSASPDTMVQIWDCKKGTVGARLKGHKDKIYDAKFNHSNKYIASCGVGGQILIWDLSNTTKPIKIININQMFAYHIQWSKNDQYMFITTWQSKLYIFDGKTFQLLTCESLSDKQPSKCQSCVSNFDLYPNKIFVATDKGTIKVYEYQQNNKKATKKLQFTAHMDQCRSVTLHSNKKLLSSTSRDGSVRVWNMNNVNRPKIINNLVLHSQSVSQSVFLDEWLITASWDQNIGLWNVGQFAKV